MANCTESSLDLSFISSVLAINCKWEISPDLWGSDHYQIFMFIHAVIKKKTTHRKQQKLYSSKTGWEIFEKSLDDLILKNKDGFLDPLDIQTWYRNLVASINSALDMATLLPSLPCLPQGGRHSKLPTQIGKKEKSSPPLSMVG